MTYNVFSGTLNPTQSINQSLSPSKLPLCMGGSAPLSNTCFLRPSSLSIPNGISIGLIVFAHFSVESSYTLQWDVPFLLKIASSHGRSGSLHLILGSLGPQAKRHLSQFSGFAGLTIVATPAVRIGLIYLRT